MCILSRILNAFSFCQVDTEKKKQKRSRTYIHIQCKHRTYQWQLNYLNSNLCITSGNVYIIQFRMESVTILYKHKSVHADIAFPNVWRRKLFPTYLFFNRSNIIYIYIPIPTCVWWKENTFSYILNQSFIKPVGKFNLANIKYLTALFFLFSLPLLILSKHF